MASFTDARKLIIASYKNGILSCLFEAGKAVSLHFENGSGSLVGSIINARVRNIIPNLNAAFLDIGSDMNAFYSLESNPVHVWADGKVHDKLREGDELVVTVIKDAQKTKGPTAAAVKLLPENEEAVHTAAFRSAPCILRAAEPEWKRDALLLSSGNAEIVTDLPVVFSELTSSQPEKKDPAYDKLPKELRPSEKSFFLQGTTVPVRFYSDEKLTLSAVYSLNSICEEALSRTVWLKSGGYLVIEPTEALTVIDVNSGKTDRTRTKEENILRTNEEAAVEILRQLRLRNLSGIIVTDFIDLKGKEAKERIMGLLKKEAEKDPMGTHIVDMTRLCLVEMTRKKSGKPFKNQVDRKY